MKSSGVFSGEDIPIRTKVCLIMLGALESMAGLLALAGAVALCALSISGVTALVLGVLMPLTLLLLGGAGIFLRRQWSYLLQCLVVPVALVGSSLTLCLEIGPGRGIPLLIVASAASSIVELFFFEEDVKRWFRPLWRRG